MKNTMNGFQTKSNPIAKALNRVTKPVTIKDKKKEDNKNLCRKGDSNEV